MSSTNIDSLGVNTPDLAKLTEVRPGDVVRFRKLFEQHSLEIYRFLLRRLRNDQDAQDALQETFLRVWRQDCDGKLNGHVRAYLFTTASNLVIDLSRRAQARGVDKRVPIDAAMAVSSNDDVEASAYWRQGLDTLLSSLEELQPKTRHIFLLCHVKRLDYRQIAERLNISTRTVERHMATALDHCKDRMTDYL